LEALALINRGNAMNTNGQPDWMVTTRNGLIDSCVAKAIRTEELHQNADRLPISPLLDDCSYEPDREAIFALVEGDMELLGELVELFLDNYPSQLLEIREGIDGSDPGRIKEAAHSLKGSIGNFNATTAIELATALELMGRNGDLSFASQKLTALEVEMGQIKTALTALRIEVGA
jgi:HPt (histidine-containing phosphotransfer) domain-containing protein